MCSATLDRGAVESEVNNVSTVQLVRQGYVNGGRRGRRALPIFSNCKKVGQKSAML